MKIELYQPAHKDIWNKFVLQSKNGLFLFAREYMEYHSDRFHDNSLLIWNEREELVALLPAHRREDTLSSHNGLTYGGLIIDASMKTPVMLEVFANLLNYLKTNGFKTFIYKTIPQIHHQYPADEDRYALFLADAKLFRRNVLAIVNKNQRLPFQERRVRGVKKALKANLTARFSDDFFSYWQILNDVLAKTHDAKPVHSLEEILQLREKFPDNIKLFACFKDQEMLAGVLIYETAMVARSQYIAANDEGKALAALDLVFSDLLQKIYPEKPYFDFGPSDEDNGLWLNMGLIEQKEGFGARAIVHDHYEISLDTLRPERFNMNKNQ